jgi:hypothetical protein
VKRVEIVLELDDVGELMQLTRGLAKDMRAGRARSSL